MRKDLRIALLLSACCNFALAATSPLATTNDFYYTIPRSTNIAGRVMGENGDYSLVRYEDAAWITEAWYERLALGNSGSWSTNKWTFGAVVRGEPWSWSDRETSDYWTNATLQTCAVARYEETDIKKVLAAASGGAMTNRTRRMEAMLTGKLVSKAAITNAYAMLKGMNVVVKSVDPTDKKLPERVRREDYEVWENDEKIMDDQNTYTNEQYGMEFYRGGYGYKEIYLNKQETRWDEHEGIGTMRSWTAGSGTVELEVWVWKKENWLRGAQTPRVVESVHAYGRVWLQGKRSDEYEGGVYDEDGDYLVTNRWNREETTNATILVDLGVPQWKGTETKSNGDYLVYTLEVKPAELLATCVAAAPWLPSIEEVDAAASVPEIEDEGGIRNVEKYLEGYVEEVYLVMKLKPITSLHGW